MKTMTPLDRILLLLTGLLAAYQVAVGIDGLPALAIAGYTLAFGVLLVSGLLLIILGFEVLDNRLVAVISTLIPLGLSLGLVVEYLGQYTTAYLVFCVVGFLAVAATRWLVPGRPAVLVLALVHGISGLVIFILPLALSLNNTVPSRFALVGVGGALIGLGGLLLSFLKSGKPLLPAHTILTVLPGLLLVMTIAFVAGFGGR